jgi:hypothetical protein
VSVWPVLITLIFLKNTGSIQKNTETLLDASKEVSLEVDPKKAKYMLMSRCKKARQKHSIKIANRSLKNVSNL